MGWSSHHVNDGDGGRACSVNENVKRIASVPSAHSLWMRPVGKQKYARYFSSRASAGQHARSPPGDCTSSHASKKDRGMSAGMARPIMGRGGVRTCARWARGSHACQDMQTQTQTQMQMKVACAPRRHIDRRSQCAPRCPRCCSPRTGPARQVPLSRDFRAQRARKHGAMTPRRTSPGRTLPISARSGRHCRAISRADRRDIRLRHVVRLRDRAS